MSLLAPTVTRYAEVPRGPKAIRQVRNEGSEKLQQGGPYGGTAGRQDHPRQLVLPIPTRPVRNDAASLQGRPQSIECSDVDLERPTSAALVSPYRARRRSTRCCSCLPFRRNAATVHIAAPRRAEAGNNGSRRQSLDISRCQ